MTKVGGGVSFVKRAGDEIDLVGSVGCGGCMTECGTLKRDVRWLLRCVGAKSMSAAYSMCDCKLWRFCLAGGGEGRE
eukprot:1513962-Amphidinium_carterae.1